MDEHLSLRDDDTHGDDAGWDEDMTELDRMGPVLTADDLTHRWKVVLGQEPFDIRSIWVLFFAEDGIQLPVVVPMDDVPVQVDQLLADRLLGTMHQALRGHAPGGSLALAIARPGPGLMQGSDIAWFCALTAAADALGVTMRPVHLATAGRVRTMVLDDVA